MVWRCVRRATPRAECDVGADCGQLVLEFVQFRPLRGKFLSDGPLSYVWPNGIICASGVWIDREFHPDSVFYGAVAQAIVCAGDRCGK
jgi:hypothetical protein